MTPKQYAETYGYTKRQVYELIRTGRLQAVKVPHESGPDTWNITDSPAVEKELPEKDTPFLEPEIAPYIVTPKKKTPETPETPKTPETPETKEKETLGTTWIYIVVGCLLLLLLLTQRR